jgi:putative ABC transport system permease protein
MNLLRQAASITAMNLQALPHRLGASLVIVAGMAAVVAVAISILSVSAGFIDLLRHSGQSDRVIVGVNAVASGGGFSSPVGRSDALTLMDGPGLRRDTDGKSIASPEVAFPVLIQRRADGIDTFVPLWGVSAAVEKLRPELHLIEGRMFEPGHQEIIVGKGTKLRSRGVDLGDGVIMPGGPWTVVGTYEAAGGFYESGMLADVDTVMSAFRTNTYNSLTIQLASTEAMAEFKDWIATNPGLPSFNIEREDLYYRRAFKQIDDILSLLAYGIGSMMAIGAVFGALNTMYAAVSARTLEIATLRAIGFGGAGIVVSVLVEALALAGIGAAIGTFAAWAAFSGRIFTGAPVFTLTLAVTPTHVLIALAFAAVVGTVGGLFPAIRAARLPVATALNPA